MNQILIKIKNWSTPKENPIAELGGDYAPTILARDWKGFNNYGSVAVLVEVKEDARKNK